MIHIGIDTRLTYYRTGGISTYMRRLVQALEALDTDNRYTVFHSLKASDSLVRRFSHASLWTPAHHRLERAALSLELARFRLDVLHSPDFIPPRRGARRHIITVHDLTFLHYPQHITAEGHRYYTDQIEAATLQADHILVDSHSTRKDLIDILNVPADKITVHMLGVDESFKPLPSESLENVRQQLGLPRDYLLFVGTFEPRKNIAGLLQAYRGLLSQMPDAPSLVLVGRRGWLFDETMAHIQEMQLDKHIIWCDNIDDRALPALYNMAHVLITPSFYEGFGLPALEAMACGTVPIVSNRSSLPEVVGDVGLLIDPDDPATITEAIHHALTDSSWRATMSQAGIVRAKTFTWENTARIALETYRAVCQ